MCVASRVEADGFCKCTRKGGAATVGAGDELREDTEGSEVRRPRSLMVSFCGLRFGSSARTPGCDC
jgi:hypothetical protein